MKNDFSQYVDKDSVMTLVGKTKLEVMDQLISRAADLTKLSRDVIFRLAWKREQMMTTGVGGMLALPHVRINDILHPYVIVGVCENPIEDYQGLDDQPVRVSFSPSPRTKIRKLICSCSPASPADCVIPNLLNRSSALSAIPSNCSRSSSRKPIPNEYRRSNSSIPQSTA